MRYTCYAATLSFECLLLYFFAGVKEKGVTGLNNLGNTCFLNAALQCCSNTYPLTTYFISSMHLYELNPDNPCGMKGHMARQYGNLMQELWGGGARTVAPLKLRVCYCVLLVLFPITVYLRFGRICILQYMRFRTIECVM